MPTLKNYYFILGVNKNASPVEIEAAYQSHSAAADYDAPHASLMPDVTEAYQCLRDPVLRREYDDAFGEPSRAYSTGNVHNFKSNESGITLELMFQKRRKEEKFRKTVVRSLVAAVIFLVFAGAAINYGPKYFRGKNIAVKTDARTPEALPMAPEPEYRAETTARDARIINEKPRPRPFPIQTGGVVTFDGASCRANPSDTASVIAVMRKDTPIFVTQEIRGGDGSVWYYATNSQFKGWVNGRDVKVYKF
jgi:curved DNA-binding protein CbpA